MTVFIDPPGGWMYGFPKPYVNPEKKPLRQWLIDNGYPEKEIMGDGDHCRYFGDLEELDAL